MRQHQTSQAVSKNGATSACLQISIERTQESAGSDGEESHGDNGGCRQRNRGAASHSLAAHCRIGAVRRTCSWSMIKGDSDAGAIARLNEACRSPIVNGRPLYDAVLVDGVPAVFEA